MAHWILSAIAVLALGGGLWYFFSGSDAPAEEVIVVERRALIQEVSVTGTVKPTQSVNLAFERSGRITHVYAGVSTRVGAGTILVRLENADISADLSEAEASVKVAEAKLAELKAGTRAEEIRIAQIKVANASTSLGDAVAQARDKIADAYTKMDDAVSNKTDVLFTNPRTVNASLVVSATGQQKNDAEFARQKMEELLTVRAGIGDKTVEENSAITKGDLARVRAYLELLGSIVNYLSPTTGLSQTTIDSYKSDLATARSNINTSLTSVIATEEKVRSARSALALAEEDFKLKQAGSRPEQVSAAEADVKKALARVASVRAQLAKTLLRSPINGTVTVQDAKVGQIVSANGILTSVISDAKFQIEAQVPEADIAKIKIGDTSKSTLDAYTSDVVFEARVVKIDPAATVVDGVPTYRVTFQFQEQDERVKSGMTANIDISTNERQNAIAIPQRAVIAKGGRTYVEIRGADGAIREVDVETGLRGSDGTVEIVRGLSEGDAVVIFRENKL